MMLIRDVPFPPLKRPFLQLHRPDLSNQTKLFKRRVKRFTTPPKTDMTMEKQPFEDVSPM